MNQCPPLRKGRPPLKTKEEMDIAQREFESSPDFEMQKGKIRRLLAHYIDQKLAHKLNAQYSEALDQVKTLYIERDADQKARFISRRVSELARSSYEVSMAMTANTDRGVQIQEVLPYWGQGVSYHQCTDTPLGKVKTYAEAEEKGQIVVGWAHSHANFSRFFSATDVQRVRQDIKWFGKETRINVYDDVDPFFVNIRVMPLLVYNQGMLPDEEPYTQIAVEWQSFSDPTQFNLVFNPAKLQLTGASSVIDYAGIENALLERVWCLPHNQDLHDIRSARHKSEDRWIVGSSLQDIVNQNKG